MAKPQKVGTSQRNRPHRTLILRNRQHVRSLNMRLLRQVASQLLDCAWPTGNLNLAIYMVNRAEISYLNERFLRHKGPTDVISFDYAESDLHHASPALIHGEVIVCVEEAIAQARRFRVTWQCELVRYIVHGCLHLLGYDDQACRSRCVMKRAEDSLLRRLASQFDLRRLGQKRREPVSFGLRKASCSPKLEA